MFNMYEACLKRGDYDRATMDDLYEDRMIADVSDIIEEDMLCKLGFETVEMCIEIINDVVSMAVTD